MSPTGHGHLQKVVIAPPWVPSQSSFVEKQTQDESPFADHVATTGILKSFGTDTSPDSGSIVSRERSRSVAGVNIVREMLECAVPRSAKAATRRLGRALIERSNGTFYVLLVISVQS